MKEDGRAELLIFLFHFEIAINDPTFRKFHKKQLTKFSNMV